jgi:tetratricopeptide (TPR) repeat protein
MRLFSSIIAFLFGFTLWSQSYQLGENYFDQGEFEKAQTIFEKLVAQNSRDLRSVQKLVATYQELEKYKLAEDLLLQQNKPKVIYPNLLVSLGYNYQLQGNIEAAQEAFQSAIESVSKNQGYAYSVGRMFQQYALLDWAIKTYEEALKQRANSSFTIELARIYGEKGNLNKMFSSYLDLLVDQPNYLFAVKRNFSDFISEDANNPANKKLQQAILAKNQEKPMLVFNELLSWLYVQQNDFQKAFAQEKALYLRSQKDNIQGFLNLAQQAKDSAYATSQEILNYVIAQEDQIYRILQAEYLKLALSVNRAQPEVTAQLFNQVFEKYNSLPLQDWLDIHLLYADYLLKTKAYAEAKAKLDNLNQLNLDKFAAGQVKMRLGDVAVKTDKFNQALIYYSQVQLDLPNSALAEEATFKIAKTSFYQGDFEWASRQLNVLKTATSKFIANDALQLSVLINTNSNAVLDTTFTALKRFAKADLLAFQEKPNEALALLAKILQEHVGEEIEDDALFKKASLLEDLSKYEKAIATYKSILNLTEKSIYIDESLYALARIYELKLKDKNKAKAYYEKLLFEHENSIYFNEARQKYRKLRGDLIK